ncbi:type II secretion system protein N [Alteromonadaceae bacterium BrNp21-10]|nr:type II secretion system protein N [Alteromonadaceae bacterium BrNp21-10]
MKSTVKIVLSAIALFLFFLIWHLPATVVLDRVNLPKNIRLSGVSGTLWQGHLQQLVVNGIAINDVDWQLDALPLLMAEVQAQIDAGNSRDIEEVALSGQISLSTDHIQLSDAQVYVPASTLLAQVKLPLPIDAQGRFSVNISQLDYPQKCQQLSGKGQWLKAEVTGTQGPIVLGNFDALLSCQQDDVAIVIQSGNSFGIDATVLVKPNGKYAVNGKFKPSESLPQEVHQAAAFFGKTDAQGFYNIKL